MARAISVHELLNTRFELLQFNGVYQKIMGQPEYNGSIFIWGGSGEGKTSFALGFAKYLTIFGKVLYDSLEEGRCESQRIAWEQAGMSSVATKIQLLDKEPMNELAERLRKKRSPRIVFIDSWQYMRMPFKKWLDWREEFPNKLFVILSHADGRKPKGNSAEDAQYDSFVKLYIDRFVVFPRSRYGGNTPFVIWEQGAREAHGDAIVDNILLNY